MTEIITSMLQGKLEVFFGQRAGFARTCRRAVYRKGFSQKSAIVVVIPASIFNPRDKFCRAGICFLRSKIS